MGPRWSTVATWLIEVRNMNLAHPGARISRANRLALSQPENGARAAVHEGFKAFLTSRTGKSFRSALPSQNALAGDITVPWNPGPRVDFPSSPSTPSSGG